MTNKKLKPSLLIIGSSLLLSACSFTPVSTPAKTQLETESPNVTLTGNIIQAGNRFSINQPGKAPVELDSRKINLADYLSRTVSVTGQYSGTTLFVDKIE